MAPAWSTREPARAEAERLTGTTGRVHLVRSLAAGGWGIARTDLAAGSSPPASATLGDPLAAPRDERAPQIGMLGSNAHWGGWLVVPPLTNARLRESLRP